MKIQDQKEDIVSKSILLYLWYTYGLCWFPWFQWNTEWTNGTKPVPELEISISEASRGNDSAMSTAQEYPRSPWMAVEVQWIRDV